MHLRCLFAGLWESDSFPFIVQDSALHSSVTLAVCVNPVGHKMSHIFMYVTFSD